MNWFKKAELFRKPNLEDRDTLNYKIRFLEDLQSSISDLKKIVFQDARYVKTSTFKIANNKATSSYPTIQDLLMQAERIALDSPWSYGNICSQVEAEAEKHIRKFKIQRKNLIDNILPNQYHKWVEDHKPEK